MDVAYYLEKWTPLSPGMTFSSHMEFPIPQGRYSLPWSNGYFLVNKNGIAMHTAGQGTLYRHKNLRSSHPPCQSYSPGFATWCYVSVTN